MGWISSDRASVLCPLSPAPHSLARSMRPWSFTTRSHSPLPRRGRRGGAGGVRGARGRRAAPPQVRRTRRRRLRSPSPSPSRGAAAAVRLWGARPAAAAHDALRRAVAAHFHGRRQWVGRPPLAACLLLAHRRACVGQTKGVEAREWAGQRGTKHVAGARSAACAVCVGREGMGWRGVEAPASARSRSVASCASICSISAARMALRWLCSTSEESIAALLAWSASRQPARASSRCLRSVTASAAPASHAAATPRACCRFARSSVADAASRSA